MSDIFALSLACALALLSISTSPAYGEPPSKEKYTCDLERNSKPDNGAWVKNAGACWSNEFRNRQWCDISVQYLENDARKREFVAQLLELSDLGSSGEAVSIVEEAFNDYMVNDFSRSKQYPEINLAWGAKYELSDLIKENSSRISRCSESFSYWHKERKVFDSIKNDRFECRVGESSG